MECQDFSNYPKSDLKSVEITENGKKENHLIYVHEGTVYSETATPHQKSILEAVIHYNNANYSKIVMFGDWAVNEVGDIINTNKKCARYPVDKIYAKSETIFEHLKSKTWFDEYQEKTFFQALKYAMKHNA